MPATFVSLERVLDFVDRTTARGAPLRVATKRAERRFGLDRKLVQTLVLSRRRISRGAGYR